MSTVMDMTQHPDRWVPPVSQMEIADRTVLPGNVVSLTLRSTEGSKLPGWTPGAHIELDLPNGLVRQYSLCGDPSDRFTWRLGVLKDPNSRGGSAYVHERLDVGSVVDVRGPRNNFEFVPAAHYLFIAGGIGITPIIPMAEQARLQGASFELVYCARSRATMAFAAELLERFGPRVVLNADDESGVFDIAARLQDPGPDTAVYACGPGPLLDATVTAGARWPHGSVRVERFAPVSADTTTDVAFEVELVRTGKVVTVPADRSILDTLRESGVRLLSSCGEGTCGTCEVGVLSGEIEHRDAVLSPEERESGEMMMVCVSRCKGARLMLDL